MKCMNKFISAIGIVFLAACSSMPKKLNIETLEIEIEVVPEDYNGGYLLSWVDGLCLEFNTDHRYLENRPYELYCFITNRHNDTLGYYSGLSSPRQFTYFQTSDTNDSLINIKFLVGTNHFSGFLAEQSQKYIDQFNENNSDRIEFETVQLDISKILHKKIEINLINKNYKP